MSLNFLHILTADSYIFYYDLKCLQLPFRSLLWSIYYIFYSLQIPAYFNELNWFNLETSFMNIGYHIGRKLGLWPVNLPFFIPVREVLLEQFQFSNNLYFPFYKLVLSSFFFYYYFYTNQSQSPYLDCCFNTVVPMHGTRNCKDIFIKCVLFQAVLVFVVVQL